jgi:hypothetical protein
MQDQLYHKYCPGCQKTKLSSEFGVNRTKLRSKCKECISEYNRAKYRGKEYSQKEYVRTPDASDSQHKICTLCGEEKPLTEFYVHKKGRLGRFAWCKPCASRYNSERAKTFQRKEYKRWAFKEREYGISKEEYEELSRSQNGLCAVCQKPNIRDHFLCVDHDHETGFIRGLLCHRCNRSVGFAQDDPQTLRRLADYIEQASLVQKLSNQLVSSNK